MQILHYLFKSQNGHSIRKVKKLFFNLNLLFCFIYLGQTNLFATCVTRPDLNSLTNSQKLYVAQLIDGYISTVTNPASAPTLDVIGHLHSDLAYSSGDR
jgi:hypothetical protein